ncbi:type II toxin-antitoxin system ParD family antitoxin [Orbus wheelerorum]|uniref:type II toxin-antitoxin system ParD family antitoxin n=1 Tax=Orbus wheelerorum TaxID=3074111 RepID=UPI00370DBAA1
MTTMNISLPETLKTFVETKVQNGEYSTNSEYVKELIRKDLEREKLKKLLFSGAQSKVMPDSIDKQYFNNLRNKIDARKMS